MGPRAEAADGGSAAHSNLLSPCEIGPLSLRNRVVQPAHSKGTSVDGMPTAQDLSYKVERARGGVGLLITGSRMVHPSSATRGMVVAYRKEAIPLNRELVARVEDEGARIFAQLGHFGGARGGGYYNAAWSPAGVPPSPSVPTPKTMDGDDIRDLVEYWTRSAAYSAAAGFPGIELHFAHGYLLGQYLSPHMNGREDGYGGDLQGRAALALEVLAAVRAEIGREIVVGARIGATDETGGAGLTAAEGVEFARVLAATGEVDYLNVSAAGPRKDSWIAPPSVKDGYLVEAAASVRAAVEGVVVLAAGGVRTPAEAEAVVADGKADMVGMTRALIADPRFVEKLSRGEEATIHHCIRANQGCIRRLNQGLPVRCTVNPRAGRESVLPPTAPEAGAAGGGWVVVGGGPAGLKCAETLALRGKSVTLYEAAASLGGQVRISRTVPGSGPSLGMLVDDLERQLQRLSVEVILGQEATPATVDRERTEGVVVATGASLPPAARSLTRSGLSSKCIESVETMSGWDVLRREGLEDLSGAPIVVADELGNRCTAGVVEVLLEAGADVLLVTRRNALLHVLETTLDWDQVSRRLVGQGLQYRLNSWVGGDERDMRCFSIYDVLTGRPVDHVELARLVHVSAPLPNEKAYFAFRDSGLPTVRVGDCVSARGLDEAVYEGFIAGSQTLPEGAPLEAERLMIV